VAPKNPVRLAEEAATTDLLRSGRLHLGLSAGYADGEALFGPVLCGPDRAFDAEVDLRRRRFLAAVRGETQVS
jgi:alkanesulfonate monooxygenase SsuD/methylene tetrahydromethanopterin reductase-like flavin-dependent oxidoreductase (luciferase family)